MAESKRTPIGKFIHQAWTNMNLRCGKYRHLGTAYKNKSYANIAISLTREEFKAYCWEYKDLILSLTTPSVDRIDSAKDYSIDNIQIIELKDNIKKKRNHNTWTFSKKRRGITKTGNKYTAKITIKSKTTHLGVFETKEEAYESFRQAYIIYYNKEPW